MSVSEVAEWLGVSRGTIRNWINLGLIRAHRLNPSGKYLVEPKAVEEAIDKGRILPREEEDTENE